MTPLGLGVGLTYQNTMSDIPAIVIEDYMWEIHTTAGGGAGYLTPLALGTVSDFHDTWDLITISSVDGNYQPQTVATVSDEGYWDIDTISSGNDAIKPLDV